MPTLELGKQAITAAKVDAIAVFATSEGSGRDTTAVPGLDATAAGTELGLDLAAELDALRFTGELGSCARIPTRGKAKAEVLLVIGLGETDDVDEEVLRKGGGVAARNATKDGSLAVVVPADLPAELETTVRAKAIAEGVGLGAYAYTAYRTKAPELPSLDGLAILPGAGLKAAEVKRGVTAAAAVVDAVNLARDLVNTAPADKRPPAFADRVAEAAKTAGIKVKVWDEKDLEKGGFGGVLGVGRGSSVPPRMVELTYAPAKATAHVVLVGKGITFDTGGLSLKPAAAMMDMKSDMGGGAIVAGVMSALAALDVAVKVTGLIPMAENMPSGTAIRPGDVLVQRGGTTVEVLNTDAEGRLILADALDYGAESSPDVLIDFATLTGAQVVALGKKVSGLMGTADDVIADMLAAGAAAGEDWWHMPLPDAYAEQLKSPVADLKNIGNAGEAGMLTAGLFLKEFVGDVPWAHLDIAGPSFADAADAYYTPRGGTGTGVRGVLRYLTDLGA